MVVDTALPSSPPEAHGIPSAAILAFVDAVEREVAHLHSVMVLRHGHVVAEGWWEPYTPASPHMMFSLSKSFTSTAIGLLVAEGRLSIDDAVLSFFPDDAPPHPRAHLRALRVRHLLSMSTGHEADTLRAVVDQTEVPWTRAFLAQPLKHEPGTHFAYNSPATYMLSAIVQGITGTRLLEYLRPRLLEPLGITQATWETSPQGIDIGGWGLSVPTAAIARFGQLYLQKGMWQGRRLLPESWIDEATARQVSNGKNPASDWEQGYGYQFWRCRHGAYRGDGAFGQFCVVLPAQETVVAITAGTNALQLVLDLLWRHLLPALGPAPLRQDPAAHQALTARLRGLRLPPPPGQPTSPVGARISGKTFTVAPNDDGTEAITFDFDPTACLVTIQQKGVAHRVRCGYGTWLRAPGVEAETVHWRVGASGAWTDEHTYVAHLWYDETPFRRILTCRFEGSTVRIAQAVNVWFGPTTQPTLKGRLL